MPVSLHTRMLGLFQEREIVRNLCQQVAATLQGVVSANLVVELAQRLSASVTGVLDPAISHPNLGEYVAGQLQTPGLNLDEQMAGMRLLLLNAMAAARACIPTNNGYLLKDRFNDDGSVSVRQLLPSETATLRASLLTIVAAIPEE